MKENLAKMKAAYAKKNSDTSQSDKRKAESPIQSSSSSKKKNSIDKYFKKK
jgi:hypothetical protein